MKVILTQDVKGQGKKNEVINVSDGYARNYLFKNNLAVEANAVNVNSVNNMRKAEEHRRAEDLKEAKAAKEKLEAVVLSVSVKVGETGKLFGALNSQAVADALKEQGIEIDKKKIVLTEPIKAVGTYDVTVKLYAEVSAKLKINVTPRG
ncbi:MAG: 50S ribosomal protein L9 [Clostridiales bacterium]|jgi:large subunit ribosomal protein L9|nr:50S ribosomal protein L9 [Clostridiales bacterium]